MILSQGDVHLAIPCSKCISPYCVNNKFAKNTKHLFQSQIKRGDKECTNNTSYAKESPLFCYLNQPYLPVSGNILFIFSLVFFYRFVQQRNVKQRTRDKTISRLFQSFRVLFPGRRILLINKVLKVPFQRKTRTVHTKVSLHTTSSLDFDTDVRTCAHFITRTLHRYYYFNRVRICTNGTLTKHQQ